MGNVEKDQVSDEINKYKLYVTENDAIPMSS